MYPRSLVRAARFDNCNLSTKFLFFLVNTTGQPVSKGLFTTEITIFLVFWDFPFTSLYPSLSPVGYGPRRRVKKTTVLQTFETLKKKFIPGKGKVFGPPHDLVFCWCFLLQMEKGNNKFSTHLTRRGISSGGSNLKRGYIFLFRSQTKPLIYSISFVYIDYGPFNMIIKVKRRSSFTNVEREGVVCLSTKQPG